MGLGAQGNGLGGAVDGPRDGAVAEREGRGRGDQHDVALFEVHRVALGPALEPAGVAGDDVVEAVGGVPVGVGVGLTQVVAREGDGTARVLLLDQPQEVGRVADLGLDLLLAVAEVVVRDHCDDDAPLVAGTRLERRTVVVALVRGSPAHAVAALALGGVVEVRQPELLLGEARQVGGEDHEAGVSGPGLGIERRVVLREVRIAAVAEDPLDEIEVGHHRRRGDETGLHTSFDGVAGHGRNHDRAQEQGDPARGTLKVVRGVGQHQRLVRRKERLFHQPSERLPRHRDLVVLDRETALGDVEDALGGASVVGRVVQDAVDEAVAGQEIGRKGVAVDGE